MKETPMDNGLLIFEVSKWPCDLWVPRPMGSTPNKKSVPMDNELPIFEVSKTCEFQGQWDLLQISIVLIKVWRKLPWTMGYQYLKCLNGLVTCEFQGQWDLLQIKNQYKIQHLIILNNFQQYNLMDDIYSSLSFRWPSWIFQRNT